MHLNKISLTNFRTISLAIFVLILIFTRFWNLDHTTRFTRDESQNLVDIHRIWVDKDITLIGPIDDTKTIIYPSLTFYMLLPFAWLGDFTPVSPAYGTAFYGVLTVLLVLYLTKKVNKEYLSLFALLSLVWIPFVESARWAWNPHLVPFIQSLAIIFFLRKGNWNKLVSGVLFGLSFHLHYLAFIGFALFLLSYGLYKFYKGDWLPPVLIGLGFTFTILPFVYFDLKNPPGLFFGRFMQNNMVKTGFSYELQNFWNVFLKNIFNVLKFLGQDQLIAVVLGTCFIYLLYKDIKEKRKNLFFFIPLVGQVAIISFLPTFASRYFLLAIIFFLVWLIAKRSKMEERIVKGVFILMFFGSLIKLPVELNEPKRIPTTYTVNTASEQIKGIIENRQLEQVNLAVLASPDKDPLGDVYRHTLLVKDIRLLNEYEYHLTENLFVISISSEEVVRDDPANVLNGFRESGLVEEKPLGNGWKIYLFSRG